MAKVTQNTLKARVIVLINLSSKHYGYATLPQPARPPDALKQSATGRQRSG
jgi:hypothetical protein